MPSSIKNVRLVGVPSSSIDSEPRRRAMVPSSTTVTPLAATRWPISPANAEVFLRLKSPSRPWPTASCSITPGQPGPSTTSISPAGAGTASRLIKAWRTALSTAPCLGDDEALVALAAAITVAAGLLPIAIADHDRNIDANHRPDVAIGFAVGAQDFDGLPGSCDTRGYLPHARVLGARIGIDRLQQLCLGFERGAL